MGFLGLAAFLLIIFQFLKFGFKKLFENWELKIGNLSEQNGKMILLALMASMITLLVHGLVDVPYFKNDLSILFWLIIGSSIVALNLPLTKNKKQTSA